MEMSLRSEWHGLVGMGWWLEEMRLESLRVEKTSMILWLCPLGEGKSWKGRPVLSSAAPQRMAYCLYSERMVQSRPPGSSSVPTLITPWEIYTVHTHKSMLETQASYIIKYVEIANNPLKSSRKSHITKWKLFLHSLLQQQKSPLQRRIY